MNFYYGLVDLEHNGWGFIEEDDPRVRPDMIFLTHEQWQRLLNEQSQGKEIVCWDGKVFTSEQGRYWVDAEGWHKKTDEEFNLEKANAARESITNHLFEIKAAKAYGGVIVNGAVKFETNQTSITNTVASIALMRDTDTTHWKFYTLNDEPIMIEISKVHLLGLAQFGRDMIDACFAVEGNYIAQLKQATIENLIDDAWVKTFEEAAQAAMDEVDNTIDIEFV